MDIKKLKNKCIDSLIYFYILVPFTNIEYS